MIYYCDVKLQTEDVKYDLSSLSSSNYYYYYYYYKRRFFRVNFLINAAFEHLRMPRLLGAAFISLFHSQMLRLLEGSVYKRVAFKRENTV